MTAAPSVDVSLFRFINSSLGNPFFDRLMPWASDPPWFALPFSSWPASADLERRRARAHLRADAGPLLVPGQLAGVRLDQTRWSADCARFKRCPTSSCASGRAEVSACLPPMPPIGSARTMILLVYYRRTIWFMLPLALLVCFSRVYNGVHYPSDVLAGAASGRGLQRGRHMGPGRALAMPRPALVPALEGRLPSLTHPVVTGAGRPEAAPKRRIRNGCVWDICWSALFFVLRLAYLAAGKIELTEDEAYQWLWSKHPAFSYYSKPPLIACTQFLGTHLWGDNEFGVRFFSPVIAAVLSMLVLRFLARASGRPPGLYCLL